jgi:hypothetical protein
LADYLGSSQGSSDTNSLDDIAPNDLFLLSQLIKETDSCEKYTALSKFGIGNIGEYNSEKSSIASEVKLLDEFAAEFAAASKRNRKQKSLKKLQILGIQITLAALWTKFAV